MIMRIYVLYLTILIFEKGESEIAKVVSNHLGLKVIPNDPITSSYIKANLIKQYFIKMNL